MNPEAASLLAELARDVWAMEPRALEAFFSRAAGLSLKIVSDPAAFVFDEAPRRSRASVGEDGTAVIPVEGVLLKRVPRWVRALGMDATGYGEIAGEISAAAEDPRVKSIRLVVDSPGGQVAGLKEASDAIFEARRKKPVEARIEDIATSAAYWLASQAGRISAGPNAQVGSIGVYTVVPDTSKLYERVGIKVNLVSSGPHKGLGTAGVPVTEDQLSAERENVLGVAGNFVADVARGRGRSYDEVSAWATGRTWTAGAARELGLVDEVSGSVSSPSGGRAASSESKMTGVAMDEQQQQQQAALSAAAEEARVAERKRLADLNAAFPHEPAFVMEQYSKGASLLEAKAAYADVLAERAAKLARENAELKAKVEAGAAAAKAPVGAPPLAQGESRPDAVADLKGSQLALVQAAREDHAEHLRNCRTRLRQPGAAHACCSFLAAFQRAKRAHPELLAPTRAAQRAAGIFV